MLVQYTFLFFLRHTITPTWLTNKVHFGPCTIQLHSSNQWMHVFPDKLSLPLCGLLFNIPLTGRWMSSSRRVRLGYSRRPNSRRAYAMPCPVGVLRDGRRNVASGGKECIKAFLHR